MKVQLEKENIQVHILSNVLYDAQAMGELEKMKGAVLVEGDVHPTLDTKRQHMNTISSVYSRILNQSQS